VHQGIGSVLMLLGYRPDDWVVQVAYTVRLVVCCNSAVGSGSQVEAVEADEVDEVQAAEAEDARSVRSSEAVCALL